MGKTTSPFLIVAVFAFLFLAIQLTQALQTEKFNVILDIDDSGMTHKILYITIQNLQDSSDNLDLKTILNSTDFDTAKVSNVRFAIWSTVPYSVTVPDYGNCSGYHYYSNSNTTECPSGEVYIEKNSTDLTCEYSYSCQVGSHEETRYKDDWVYKSLVSKAEDDLKGEMKHKWEQIPIQKAGQSKDTLKFKLEFDHPIVKTKDGWGSQGILWLDINGNEYVDLTHSSWWNSTWQRKAGINITNSGSTILTNYQVAINLTYDSDMVSDFSDIRFVNGSENAELSYWMESKVDSSWAYFWVKILNIPTGTSTIYVYYKNTTVISSASNGTNTFPIFDNFDTTFNSTGLWYEYNEGTNNAYTSGGELVFEYPNAQYTHYITTHKVISTGAKFYFEGLRVVYSYGASHAFYWGAIENLDGGSLFRFLYHKDVVEKNMTQSYVTSDLLMGLGATVNWAVEGNYSMTWNSTHIKFYKNDNLLTTHTTQIPTADLRLGFGSQNYGTPAITIYVDLVRASSYTLPEPTYSIGTEEQYDKIPPTWSNMTTNAITNQTKTGEKVYFNITLTDETAPGHYIFNFYDGTAWTSDPAYTWENNTPVKVEKTITATRGQTVSWYWWFDDAAGNNQTTGIWNWNITVANTAPTHDNPILNSTFGTNFRTENLTCYNKSTYDPDSDPVNNIYNWYKNNAPLAVLNIPFESSARDYSGYGNNGTIHGATFTIGKVGNALSFDGTDDYVDTRDINEAEGMNSLTVEAWVKPRLKAASVINPMILAKYLAWNLYINSNNNGFVFAFNDGGGWATDSVTYGTALSTDIWYHVVGRYDGSTCKIFVNGDEAASATCNGNITTNTNTVKIGQWNNNEWFNGTIDEVLIYPSALTAQQIKQRYDEMKNGKIMSSTIVGPTTPGETYMCQVTPNDGFEDGVTKSSNNVTIVWNITFNITSAEDGSQLKNVNIYCNNSWNVTGVNSPYSHGFLPGDYRCTFVRDVYFDETTIFAADNDKIVNVKMSRSGYLSLEEHKWLEAIYKCLYSGDCLALNLLFNINQTTSKIWNQFKRTDQTIVTFENITSHIVSNTSNLTINYSVNVPIKEGYGMIVGLQGYDDFLPIRVSYWFLDTTNTTCYNQGSKPVGVESPYCQALTTTTVGQINTTINFIVDLRPDLPIGNYTVVRNIEIDPDNRWIDYGQEIIGKVEILSSGGGLISLKYTGEIPKEVLETAGKTAPETIPSETGIITGLVGLLTATNISLLISLITLGLVGYIIITMRRRY